MAEPGYATMWEHLEALDEAGLLVTVDREINKDTEMHPLVRWQYRGGIPEEERKAFLFTNVTDSQGREFDIPVTVGALSANTDIYARGVNTTPENIRETWSNAAANPIEPVGVGSDDVPAHEIVYTEDDFDEEGRALDGIPVPLSTPGWDNAPYTSMSAFVTHHPETGERNIGLYRAQWKTRTRTGMNPSIEWAKGIYDHWQVAKERGETLPAALVVSAPPCIAYAGCQSLPLGQDELGVAGALVGEPIRETEARTQPVMIPADADIVVEGEIRTDILEPEAPFGESHGYINPKEYNMVMDVTSITRSANPLFTSIISQVTPSESSTIKKVALEPLFYRHLTETCGLTGVTDFVMHEPLTNLRKLIVVQVEHGTKPSEVWRALNATISFRSGHGKIVVAVDEDIDPNNPDAVFWAMGYRSSPHKDVQIIEGRDLGHSPRHEERGSAADSALLWDATLKEPKPPISLPKREYMEAAREIWDDLDLPTLDPQMPWYGYSLGEWNDELDREAQLAVESRYFENGEKLEDQRVSTDDVEPNTSVYGPEIFPDKPQFEPFDD